ncbi:hypothetical protein ACS0TY_036670 [Phlomoides rotata]
MIFNSVQLFFDRDVANSYMKIDAKSMYKKLHISLTKRYTISRFFNLALNTLLKLYNVLIVTPEPAPKDIKDYR